MALCMVCYSNNTFQFLARQYQLLSVMLIDFCRGV